MRFPCCAKVFPCDICHDKASNHHCDFAKTILCGFCSKEQNSKNNECIHCGKQISTAGSGKF